MPVLTLKAFIISGSAEEYDNYIRKRKLDQIEYPALTQPDIQLRGFSKATVWTLPGATTDEAQAMIARVKDEFGIETAKAPTDADS